MSDEQLEENVIGNHENVYLMQYDTEEEYTEAKEHFEIVNNSGKSIKDIDVVSDKAVIFDDLQTSINKKESASLHFEGEIMSIKE